MIKDKQSVIDILKNNRQEIGQFGVTRVGLFGSFVRGEQIETSDVDVLVDFESGQKTFRNLLGFADLAEELLGRPVEVVTPKSLSPFIAPYIEREAEYIQIS